jgi:putative flavoprotein involved in K+ transport
MSARHDVVVIGGGQAGLSMSYCLRERGIDHVVLERHRIAHAWRSERWDSFCLVTPNWQCTLPGFPYAGSDPEGFMVRDDIVRYVEAYAASFGAPVREGVSATRLARDPASGTFTVGTSAGDFEASAVVVAAGGYHVAKIPRLAERLPSDIVQLHSSQYRNAESLPPGAVLVVGTGQSGCQIAEDLHLAGRTVHLCVGSAPRVARRYRGKDCVEWLDKLGYYDLPVEQHPLKEGVRRNANHYVTGRGGGRDIDLRKFASEGMRLHGRLLDVRDGKLSFGNDLAENLDRADAVMEGIKTTIDGYIEKNGIAAPEEARYTPVWHPDGSESDPLDLAAAGISTVVWGMGFVRDYSWIDIPIFDGRGYPVHQRGITSCDGLYFLGLPWLHTWGSGRFSGIARDATYLAGHVADHVAARGPVAETVSV